MQRNNRAIIIYSGGMDSFTLLNELVRSGIDVRCVSFDYGQRHSKELSFAAKVCGLLGVPHAVVDMRQIGAQLLPGSSLTSLEVAVPLGHYAQPSMKATVVANRNMIMLSLAVGLAVSSDVPIVYTAVHAGDHAIYPDCRPEFIRSMNLVTAIANYDPVEIGAPYSMLTKGEILQRGTELSLDYALSWTCYNGREKACGRCGACVERLEAFGSLGATDPLQYES